MKGTSAWYIRTDVFACNSNILALQLNPFAAYIVALTVGKICSLSFLKQLFSKLRMMMYFPYIPFIFYIVLFQQFSSLYSLM